MRDDTILYESLTLQIFSTFNFLKATFEQSKIKVY